MSITTQALLILKLRSNAVPGGLMIPQTPLNAEDAVALGMSPEEALNERTSIMLMSGHTVPVKHLLSPIGEKDGDGKHEKVPYVELTVEEETGRIWEGWKSFVPANRATSRRSWELKQGYLMEEFHDDRVIDKAARGADLPVVAIYPYADEYGTQNIDIHEVWRRLTYDLNGFIDEMTALIPPPLPTIGSSDVGENVENLALTFHQDIPSVLWRVEHELGRIPVVQVCDEDLKVVPYTDFTVQHTNENLLVIVWSGSLPRVGLVRLV